MLAWLVQLSVGRWIPTISLMSSVTSNSP
jgi:hypothetical protein